MSKENVEKKDSKKRSTTTKKSTAAKKSTTARKNTTKKTVRKTNILKKNVNLTISQKDQIKFEGMEKPEEEKKEEKQEEKKEIQETKARDWNKLLKQDGQQYNFVIKRISKNIYKKYQELKDIQEKEKEKSIKQ